METSCSAVCKLLEILRETLGKLILGKTSGVGQHLEIPCKILESFWESKKAPGVGYLLVETFD